MHGSGYTLHVTGERQGMLKSCYRLPVAGYRKIQDVDFNSYRNTRFHDTCYRGKTGI